MAVALRSDRRLVISNLTHADARGVSQKLTPSLTGYALAIAIGLALPAIAVALYLAIAIHLVVPFRSLRRAGGVLPDSDTPGCLATRAGQAQGEDSRGQRADSIESSCGDL